jgi:hypothetical protein
MSTVKRLTERTAAPFAGSSVDRDAGTISGVLICGTKSANRRDYPVSVFRRDFAKYEGRPVNADHAKESTVDRRLGWFTNVAPGSDGRPRGTLHLLKSHPLFERVMEAAERNPSLYGFSHVVMAKTRHEGGREVVEAIESVESIDLVAEPATTNSLFEGKPVGLTVKALCEALVKHPKTLAAKVVPLKALAEMDGMGDLPAGMDAAPADDADPAEGVSAAFKAAIMHIVQSAMSGDHDPKEALSKIKKLLASHGEVNGAAEPAEEPEPEREEKPAESKRPSGNAILEAIDVCATAGFTGYTSEDLETIAAVHPDRRAKLAERLKGAATAAISPAETPRSTGRTRPVAEAAASTPETTSEGIRKRWQGK